MAYLKIYSESGEQLRQLNEDLLTIGRGSSNMVALLDQAASSKHAQIVRAGDRWRLEERGSLNGTFVNGVRLEPTHPHDLRDGDQIQIGATDIIFGAPVEPSAPATGSAFLTAQGSSFLQSFIGDDESAHDHSHQLLNSFIIDDAADDAPRSEFRRPLADFDPADTRPQYLNRTYLVDADGRIPPPHKPPERLKRRPGESLLEAKLRMIQRVGEMLVRIVEPKQLMEEILTIVIEQTGAERGILCLLDDNRQPVPIASRGLSEGDTVRVSRTVIRRVLEEGVGVLVDNNSSGSNLMQSLADIQVTSAMCVPLWTGEKIEGLLSLDMRSTFHKFTDEDLELLTAVAHQAALCIHRLRFSQEVENQRLVRRKLCEYLDPQIVEVIAAHRGTDNPLAPTEREITVLFSDIVSFTKLSENMAPAQLATFIREYLSVMTDIVFKHGGTIDKYIGDAVMALFGAPIPSEDSAASAIRAALDMRDKLREIQLPADHKGAMLRARFGMNTGPVIVGNIGSSQRTEYTAIGDTVNVAQRLQAFARPNEICIDDVTHSKTTGAFLVEEIGAIEVKNRFQPLTVYKVLRAR